MRNGVEATKDIKKGAIIQISPKADLGFEGAGRLAIVQEKHGWGVDVAIVGFEGTRALTWANIEPTGGMLVWDNGGNRLKPEEGIRHHE